MNIKKFKKIILSMALVVTLGVGLTACAQKNKEINENKNTIKIGTSGQYYPFTFIDKDSNKVQGFEIDIWEEIGKRTGYKPEFKVADWTGIMGMLDTGKIDTVANEITVTDKKKEKYYFSKPYVYSGVQLATKKGNNNIKSLKDLEGKTVATQVGTNYSKSIEDYNNKNKGEDIKTKQYNSFSGMFQDVDLGRVDALIEDKLACLVNIKKSGLNLQLAGEPIEEMENAYPFVKKDENKEKIEKINKALDDMKKDGTLQNISKKWFGENVTEKSKK
ncbi:amino acid ABC transporter substrate-binding protein [Clostridium sporogenes]|uniref:amino acid ABC transporter substrate-binding protein n=1 Tax=Clostridium sporogenes TaxID=1509 RepID=UPI0013D3D90D|nr:amino acid ABC transporter substrate-binding protein [Clostridium sporogenes]NFE81524.1 amino acid ABC transporter substrate-binding protein [Clostridium sporogenes]NFG67988.1 amino acid ABC transporter substrate-binding protein [Clostridium sporogenes]